ncbi:MAG: 2-oxoacid:acceptor oxidoreductase family protein [Deltaproteobacteria bacterium]|nr:2-oxoacid:acceptor oxidoreductase family protein [Deltaproteobacteria bacterium]
MENINFNFIVNGTDFQEIKFLSQILYLSLLNENYTASISIKSLSNISNYNLSFSLIKIGKIDSVACVKHINALVSLDYQSVMNYLEFFDNSTIVLVNYSKFNICNYFLADNDSVDNNIKQKTGHLLKIPVEKIVNIDLMGKNKVSPNISLLGALSAKSGVIDLDNITSVLASISKNDTEKKNYINTLIAGYDFVNS